MAEQITKTVEQLIVDHLDENGQKLSWLAKKIGCSSGHLHLVLKLGAEEKNKRELTQENKLKINEALKTNF